MSKAKPSVKMDIENRAKQFAPFSALVGLEDALAAMETVVMPKSELSEEMKSMLDDKMNRLTCGTMATVTYYRKSEYVRRTGMVAKILPQERVIQIVDERISFDDITDIEFEGAEND